MGSLTLQGLQRRSERVKVVKEQSIDGDDVAAGIANLVAHFLLGMGPLKQLGRDEDGRQAVRILLKVDKMKEEL